MAKSITERVRTICQGFPGVTERLSHGAPSFFVGRQFAALWHEGHHDNEFPHLWCAAPEGAQEELLTTSERFFRPPYVGGRGWIGMRLDGKPDWAEVAEVLEDAYRTIAPPKLLRELP